MINIFSILFCVISYISSLINNTENLNTGSNNDRSFSCEEELRDGEETRSLAIVC